MAEEEGSYTSGFEQFFTELAKEEINKVIAAYPKKRSVEVDYRKLERYDPDLASKVIEDPDEAILSAERAIQNMEITLPNGEVFKPHVRFYNLPDPGLMIENIGSHLLNKMISFKGLVNRRGEVNHKVKIAIYKCNICGEAFRFPVGRSFKPPTKCPVCKKGTLRESLDESKFVDFQIAEVQDLLERVRSGSPAAKILIFLEDDLVNSIVPGENVQITGILRVNPYTKRTKNMVFTRYIDVTHVRKLKKDFEEIEITKEDEKRILDLASKPNIEDLIVNSIAPDIWGYEEVKRALALQLFGGTKGKRTTAGAPIRDDIHILLVGDPGIAKTRFLQHVVSIAPKSIYVSGKSVTGVGLTASAEKDELSGTGWTLKAGALVLASGGIAAIDEFDKIDDEDRAALHEVMESQTVSIAKAGIVARFRAKTAIVAAANPKFGRFIRNRNIPDQFNIPPSLLSRFDLIFPILDVLDVSKDEALAEHILNIHKWAGEHLNEEKAIEKSEAIIEPELLRKYIAYARKNIKPVLSKEAADVIKDFYVRLRVMGQKTGTVPITPRYLEGLVRLAEANAKMRLSNIVEARDASTAVSLMKYVMDQVMVDKETGLYDSDLISTGASRTKQQRWMEVLDIIRRFAKQYDKVEVESVIEEAKSVLGLDDLKVRQIIEELRRQGWIYEPSPGTIGLLEKE